MAKKVKAKTAKVAKAAKAPRVPKTKANAPGAAAVQAETKSLIGDNSLTDKERQDLFLKHVGLLAAAKDKLANVVAGVRNAKKRIKGDGFTVAQVEDAIEMQTPEGEEKIKALIEESLQAARWVGVAWGTQLDMFNGEPDRTPIADRAYSEGERASMGNKPAKPDYSPDTEAYRRYMDGFHAHQATIGKGFKKPKPDANGGEKPEEVTSGERVTRSEFKQRLQEATASDENGASALKH